MESRPTSVMASRPQDGEAISTWRGGDAARPGPVVGAARCLSPDRRAGGGELGQIGAWLSSERRTAGEPHPSNVGKLNSLCGNPQAGSRSHPSASKAAEPATGTTPKRWPALVTGFSGRTPAAETRSVRQPSSFQVFSQEHGNQQHDADRYILPVGVHASHVERVVDHGEEDHPQCGAEYRASATC